jgi:2-polyprenyl-3-methyl-5-hydroxy-6-metoxy-1,4-benzoquinol methylase
LSVNKKKLVEQNLSQASTGEGYCCWLCTSKRVDLVKRSISQRDLESADFKITDSNYGMTADVYECRQCGFKFCPHMNDVLRLYVHMEDEQYEETRSERAVQAEKLLRDIAVFHPGGRLLDVGAASGILVEQAILAGYDASGIEPSEALQQRAKQLNLPVELGVLPAAQLGSDFDIVTFMDVLEHVPNPVDVLGNIANVLGDTGICVIATPDIDSFVSRVMGHKWWHFRLAHIGYFSRKTLTQAVEAAGMEVICSSRPSWYFPASYLLQRVLSYFPSWFRPPLPGFLDRVIIPLNLGDSIQVICRKKMSPPSREL